MAVRPPSTTTTAPVMNDACGEASDSRELFGTADRVYGLDTHGHVLTDGDDVRDLAADFVLHRYLADHPVPGGPILVDGLLLNTLDLARAKCTLELGSDTSLRILVQHVKHIPPDRHVARYAQLA